VDDLGADTVLAFLAYLEAERKNCVATRNYRLIAVHRFFAYVADVDPQHAELCRRVLDVPVKKTVSSSMTYLDRDEMKTLLAVPRPSHRHGVRDVALLTFVYNTGARASEAVGLSIKDIRFETPVQVRIVGKGRKERACPLWPETVQALQAYFLQRHDGPQPDAPVFLNAHGRRLGRFGVVKILKRHVAAAAKQQSSLAAKRISPHTLRHTAAMHLLQSGVELNVIKSWLGHVSITTTSQYIEIYMAMKREALKRCTPPVPEPTGDNPWRSRKDIIEWLEDL
jgi:site-specific recombinase XerD